MNFKDILSKLCEIFQYTKKKDGTNFQEPDKIQACQLDETPDEPIAFGYKTAWLAVKDTNIDKIVEDLNIKIIGKANWASGLNASYGGRAVFVTPPIHGWTFVIGLYLNDWKNFILMTSKSIPDFFYFFTERVSDTHAWIFVKNRAIIRAFGYSGSSGEVLFDEGNLTKEEIALDLVFEKLKNNEFDDDIIFPDEDDVLNLSAAWTIDTLGIEDMGLKKSLGIVGIFDHKRS